MAGFQPAQPFHCGLEFLFGRQGNRTGVAAFKADFTAWQAAKWVRYNWLPGFRIPFKDIVWAEVEAMEIPAAELSVNGGKPW